MHLFAIIFLLPYKTVNGDTDSAQGVHLPLYRRGGSFSQHGSVNLTQLSHSLVQIEARYSRTHTDVEGNRIVRRWRDGPHGADEYLLDGAGRVGSWYTVLQVGSPPQQLEVDIDMLSPDFYTVMTTSGKGSKYDTFASSSHEPSQEHTHPTCLQTSDLIHVPILDSSSATSESRPIPQILRVPFPICQPQKYTHHTLNPSGSILGLSPTTNSHSHSHSSLSRLTSPSLLSHLLSTSTITTPLIHILLLTSTSGLLTLGAPPTYILEHTKTTLEKQLSLLSSPSLQNDIDRQAQLEAEVSAAMNFLVPPGSDAETHFTWTDSGAGGVKGWHTGLLGGVWVNGVKVLRNQAVVFDVNCPVVLVPRGVASVIFGRVGGRRIEDVVWDEDQNQGVEHENTQTQGSRRTSEHDKVDRSGFWAYPCLNVPIVEVEIGGWRFPIAGKDGFGLGKVDMAITNEEEEEEEIGTGYCVSVIVETDMGERSKWAGSGMKDVWVLGEPFFSSVGVVFDFGGDGRKGKSGRVGVRRY